MIIRMPRKHWTVRRFERKHDGIGRGLLLALPVSIVGWVAITLCVQTISHAL